MTRLLEALGGGEVEGVFGAISGELGRWGAAKAVFLSFFFFFLNRPRVFWGKKDTKGVFCQTLFGDIFF